MRFAVTYSAFVAQEYYGDLIDTEDTAHISDADKGAAAAYVKNFVHAQTIICREHRAATAMSKFGKKGKDAHQLYCDFANAHTEAEISIASQT